MNVEEHVKSFMKDIDEGRVTIEQIVEFDDILSRIITVSVFMWFMTLVLSAVNLIIASLNFAENTLLGYVLWLVISILSGFMFLLSRDHMNDVETMRPAKKKIKEILKRHGG